MNPGVSCPIPDVGGGGGGVELTVRIPPPEHQALSVRWGGGGGSADTGWAERSTSLHTENHDK